MQARQKPEKRRGKKMGSPHGCDKLYQCPAIVDRTISVFCPVSCNVVYATNLLICKINADEIGDRSFRSYAFQTFPGATCTSAIASRVSTMHRAQSSGSR